MANPKLEASIAMAERQGWRLVSRTEAGAEFEQVAKIGPRWWWLLIYWPVWLLAMLYRLVRGKSRVRMTIEIDPGGRVRSRRWREPLSN